MSVHLVSQSLEDAYWFLFNNNELLVKNNNGTISIPRASDITLLASQLKDAQSMGLFHAQECFIATTGNEIILPGFCYKKIRPLYGQMEDESFGIVCRAFHLINWLKTSKFCGCCGAAMTMSPTELAMKCPRCNHLVYPRISPAIIVAVTRGSQILLARSDRFPPNRYSVIAGFVEPGETLEECVQRELQEEVGIKVHSINYFGSQPWSFPDSLMVAFTAECSTERITIDNHEIVAAAWFSAHNLPDLPDKPSISRQLIDSFTEKYK